MQNKLSDYDIYLLNERDKKTFLKVFDTYFNRMYYFSFRLISDKPQAEDIAITTLHCLWDSKEKFETEENLKYFLYHIAKNKCLNFINSRYARDKSLPLSEEHHVLEDSDFLHALEEAEVINTLKEFMEMLPGKHGEVAKLYYCKGLNNAEIAKELNISVNAVSRNKRHAIAKLRKLLNHRFINIATLLMALVQCSGGMSIKYFSTFVIFSPPACLYGG